MPAFNPASLNVIGKRKSFPVPGVSSLYLRVSETGTKTWIVKYKIGRIQRRYTIGRYPELPLATAKKEALRIRGGVSLGHDPQEERREDRKALTIKAIAELYIEKAILYLSNPVESVLGYEALFPNPFFGRTSNANKYRKLGCINPAGRFRPLD